jgi:hypothetical protein
MSSRNAVSAYKSKLVLGLQSYLTQVTANPKNTEPYLGLLYTMDDVAVYGYITASKMKIILALSLSDTVVKDVEVVNVSTPNAFFSDTHDPLCSLFVFRVC